MIYTTAKITNRYAATKRPISRPAGENAERRDWPERGASSLKPANIRYKTPVLRPSVEGLRGAKCLISRRIRASGADANERGARRYK